MHMIHDPIGSSFCGSVAGPAQSHFKQLPLGADGVAALAEALAAGRGLAAGPGFLAEASSRGADTALRESCAAGRTPFGATLEAEVRSNRRILVFGDYDGDGVCATASMVMALCSARSVAYGSGLGQGVAAAASLGISHVVPERRQGYGIQPASMREAAAAGVHTVVACDNGSNAIEALQVAHSLGLRVLVVDHHPLSPLSAAWWTPERRALLWNPMAGGDAGLAMSRLGFGLEACASLLVDLVAAELLSRIGVRDGHPQGALLAGIATVTDVMPALGANRSAIRTALSMLGSGDCLPGLGHLVKDHFLRSKVAVSAGFSSPLLVDAVDSDFLGFDLGPRLNACGRIGTAALAVEMILATADAAGSLAARVEAANLARRAAQQLALAAVAELVGAVDTQSSVLAELVAEPHEAEAVARSVVRVLRSPDGSSLIAHVPGVVALVCSMGGDAGVAGLVASSVARSLRCPALYCGMGSLPSDDGPCTLVGSGRVPEGSSVLAVSTGAIATAVFASCGGSAGGHAAAFGARIVVPPGRGRFVAAIKLLAVRMAAGIGQAMAALGPEAASAALGVGLSEAESASVRCDIAVSLDALTPALASAVVGLGPFGPGFSRPTFLVDVPPASIKPMGTGGTFSVEAGQGRRGPRMIGFANAFNGGAPVLAADGSTGRMASEGCVIAGALKSSYYGLEQSASSWRGPSVELVANAIASRSGRVGRPGGTVDGA